MKSIFIPMLLLSLLLFACSGDKLSPTINTRMDSNEIPTQESWDAEIQFSEDGRTKAILYADHLYVYENQKTTYLEGVKINSR